VNLTQQVDDFPSELRATATSVAAERGRPDAQALLREFLVRMKRLTDHDHQAFPDTVLRAYREVCDTLGREVRATTTAGMSVEGRAVAVDDLGQLVVETSSGAEVVAFDEIHHLT
jgi:BirA family biotin operon repressor/biotin-[acetyl-CoA-carboxylase] ligase